MSSNSAPFGLLLPCTSPRGNSRRRAPGHTADSETIRIARIMFLAGFLCVAGSRDARAEFECWANSACWGNSEPYNSGNTVSVDLGTVVSSLAGVLVEDHLLFWETSGCMCLKQVFKNTTSQSVDVLYCSMVSRINFGNMVMRNRLCFLEAETVVFLDVVACRDDPDPHYVAPGYHFGCFEIKLDPGETKQHSQDTGPLTQFGGDRYWVNDFQVRYADVFDLAGKTFLPTTCDICVGENNYLGISAEARLFGAIWIQECAPFVDPFVMFQQIGPPPSLHEPQYSPFSDYPCLPEAFPFTIPGLPYCPTTELRSSILSEDPLPPLSLTLFLSDNAQMGPEADEPLDAYLSIRGERELKFFGVSVTSDPPAFQDFQIPPSIPFFGSATVVAPKGLPEGRRGTLRFNVHNALTNDIRFYQTLEIIQDTLPPVVSHHFALQDSNGVLNFVLVVEDETTEVESVNVWYSIVDGTDRWSVVSLSLTFPEVLDRLSPEAMDFVATEGDQVAAVGQTPPLPQGAQVQYFFRSQDTVKNFTYYGVATKLITNQPDIERFFITPLGPVAPPPTIPTVSAWGLMVLALMLAVAAKLYFGRRHPAA